MADQPPPPDLQPVIYAAADLIKLRQQYQLDAARLEDARRDSSWVRERLSAARELTNTLTDHNKFLRDIGLDPTYRTSPDGRVVAVSVPVPSSPQVQTLANGEDLQNRWDRIAAGEGRTVGAPSPDVIAGTLKANTDKRLLPAVPSNPDYAAAVVDGDPLTFAHRAGSGGLPKVTPPPKPAVPVGPAVVAR